MKITKIAILVVFLCGALTFQLFMPTGLIGSDGSVQASSAVSDELSDTIWNIKDTIYALEFDSYGGVTFLEYNDQTDDFDVVVEGTYRVRGNTVTLSFGGGSGNMTIGGGRRRNVLTGNFTAGGERFTVTAIRAGN